VLRVKDGSSCECTLLRGLRGVSAVGCVHSCRYCYSISSRLDHSHADRCGWRRDYLEHRSSRSLCFIAALIRLAAHAAGTSYSAHFCDLLRRRISLCGDRVVQTIPPPRHRSQMRNPRRRRSDNRNAVVALRRAPFFYVISSAHPVRYPDAVTPFWWTQKTLKSRRTSSGLFF
jgi:hypothetical protein